MTATKFTARFTTAGRLDNIESWLKQHVKGKWSFKLDSVSDDMSKKNYVLIFDDAVDSDSFKTRFSLGKNDDKKVGAKKEPGVFQKFGAMFSTAKPKAK